MDGSAHAADLLRDVFDKLGFSNVQVVNDGYEGIQAMKRKSVHLIFTDSELRVRKRSPLHGELPSPDTALSGTEFVRRLRHSPRSPNPFVPVVMVVDPNERGSSDDARSAGVNETVTKPLQAEDLCRQIMHLIDDPRYFITADTYKGPCRRNETGSPPADITERRTRQVRLVRRKEFRSV